MHMTVKPTTLMAI